MSKRETFIALASLIVGAGLCALLLALLRSTPPDAGDPYAEEMMWRCDMYRQAATLELQEAQEAVAKSESPSSDRLVDARHMRMMDAIHERTDARTDMYVRCASRQIPRWDGLSGIPNRNDRALIDYLKLVVNATPVWHQPPPPCRSGAGGAGSSLGFVPDC